MNQKISAVVLAISLMLGVSANSAVYGQPIITPGGNVQQPQIAPQLQQGGQPITFQENAPPLTPNQGQGQQLPPPPLPVSTQTNLQSPLLTNTPEGLNQANNLNNFNLSVQDKQSLVEFFNKCPNGIILYKVNGQFFVYCFTSPFAGKLFGLHGEQPVNIDIKVVTKHSSGGGNNDDKKRHHNGDNNNNGGPDEDCLFNASLPKCDPDEDGNCPDGFNLNEDGNCFPDHSDEGCPEGTHGVDDDETGQCYDNDEGCPDGMTFREDGQSCGYTDELCEDGNENPNCEEVPVEDPIIPPPAATAAEDPALLNDFGIAPTTPIDTLNGQPLEPITDDGSGEEVPSEIPTDANGEVPGQEDDVDITGDDGSSTDGEDSGSSGGGSDDNGGGGDDNGGDSSSSDDSSSSSSSSGGGGGSDDSDGGEESDN